MLIQINSTFKVKYYIFQWKNNIQQKLICWAEYTLKKYFSYDLNIMIQLLRLQLYTFRVRVMEFSATVNNSSAISSILLVEETGVKPLTCQKPYRIMMYRAQFVMSRVRAHKGRH